MQLQELLKQLSDLYVKHGDIPINVIDSDSTKTKPPTHYTFEPTKVEYVCFSGRTELVEKILIRI